MNRKGNFLDLAVLVIFFFIIVVFSIVMFMSSGKINEALHSALDNESTADMNYTTMLDNSVTSTDTSFGVLKWLTAMLFVGFAIVLWLSSWMVNTHPVFMVIYIFGVIATILLSVGLSNAYQMMAENSELVATISEFNLTGIIMSYLPVWVCVVGFVGLIIMFVRFKKGGDEYAQI